MKLHKQMAPYKWLCSAKSDDMTRESLCNLLATPDGSGTWATDGRRAHVIEREIIGQRSNNGPALDQLIDSALAIPVVATVRFTPEWLPVLKGAIAIAKVGHARSIAGHVKMSIGPKNVTFSGGVAGAHDWAVALPPKVTGLESGQTWRHDIGINLSYLYDALAYMSATGATCEVRGEMGPVIVRGAGGTPPWMALIMPVRL